MATIDMPMEFPGTDEERMANFASHDFYDWAMDGDSRCTACDCKPWHITAGWPCGADVPRVVAEAEDLEAWKDRFRIAAWLNA